MGHTQTTKRRAATARVGKGAGLLAVLLAAGVVATACSAAAADPVAAPPSCGGSSPKLTVQGTGLATGTPNLLTIDVGIDVTDPTAADAISDDNTKAQAVTTVL